MNVEILKNYVLDNFTPMAWERVKLKLVSDLTDKDDGEILKNDTINKIHNALEDMYGMGLSKEILNGK